MRQRGTIVGGLTAVGMASAAVFAGDGCTPVNFLIENATATWSQECAGAYSPANLVDASKLTGWGPGRCSGGPDFTLSETVVFETDANVVMTGGGEVVFTIFSGGAEACCGGGNLTLGRFRLSVTGDGRATFADGLSINGDVSANWSVITVTSITAQPADINGNVIAGTAPTLTNNGGIITVSGANPTYAVYTVRGTTTVPVITGACIELLDANGTATTVGDGLPTGGPGRHANGNCVIRDFKFAATQPPTVGLELPASITVCPGANLQLQTVGIGTGPFTYQFRKYNGNTPSAVQTSSNITYVMTPADINDSGLYDVLIFGACGNVTSQRCRVTVLSADIGVQGGVPGTDGAADNNDFVVFTNAFFDNSTFADLGKQGGTPGADGLFDNNDFVVFINLFFSWPTCPPGGV